LVISPDNQTVIFVDDNDTIRLLSRKGVNIFKGHQGEVSTVAFNPTSNTITSASYDKTIKFWNTQGDLLHTTESDDVIDSMVYSPDGKTIATNGKDRTIKLWSIDGKSINTMKGHINSISSILFSPNGKYIASVSDDKVIKLWDNYGKLLNTFQDNEDRFTGITFKHSMLFSPDSKTIAYATNNDNFGFPGTDHDIRIWNVNGHLDHAFTGHNSGINSLSFSPDGQTILSGSSDKTLRAWGITGKPQYTINDQEGNISKVLFSPDGAMTASTGNGKTIKLRNIKGNLLKTLKGYQGDKIKIMFSPDSKIIAFTSYNEIPSRNDDNTIRIWNIDGNELAV
jgi:WD40 repeat protein